MKLLSQQPDLLRRGTTLPQLPEFLFCLLLLSGGLPDGIQFGSQHVVTSEVLTAMIVRHGTKPGHQVGVQVMGDDMLHHVDIPLMQNSRSNVNLNECIQLSPLFRGGGSLARGSSVGGGGLGAGGGLWAVVETSGGGGAGSCGGKVL